MHGVKGEAGFPLLRRSTLPHTFFSYMLLYPKNYYPRQ